MPTNEEMYRSFVPDPEDSYAVKRYAVKMSRFDSFNSTFSPDKTTFSRDEVIRQISLGVTDGFNNGAQWARDND